MHRAPLLAVLAATLAFPAAASASSISYEGDTLQFRAAPGEANFVVVDGDDLQVTFTDDYPIAFPPDRCHQLDPEYPVVCDTPARLVRIDLGGGADHGSFGFMIPADRAFEIDGGPGADLLTGPRNGVGTATLDGDDDDNDFTAPEVGSAVRLSGAGGNDRLIATDAHGDVVDGGPGDDSLTGGFGDDTLVGGPGRDQIAGDRQARCNELHCDFMDGFGNDTIDARDGEQDSVQCGPGTDTVRADPQDLVADDCEHVDRPGGAAPAVAAKLTTVGSLRLRDVLRHGLRVRVPARATVTAHLGKTIVAQGAGAGVVRLKLTSRGRRLLRHRRRAVLTITAGTLRATVRLR